MGKLMHIDLLKTKRVVILYASKKNNSHKSLSLRDIICYYLVDTGAHHKEIFAVREIPAELIDKYDSVTDALGVILEKETLDWDLGLTYGAVEEEFLSSCFPKMKSYSL